MWCVTHRVSQRRIAFNCIHDEPFWVRTKEDVCICHAKIGVEQYGAAALARQGQAKIDRNAGFTNPAFTTCDYY